MFTVGWGTNMAAISLLTDTNMAIYEKTPTCENPL